MINSTSGFSVHSDKNHPSVKQGSSFDSITSLNTRSVSLFSFRKIEINKAWFHLFMNWSTLQWATCVLNTQQQKEEKLLFRQPQCK